MSSLEVYEIGSEILIDNEIPAIIMAYEVRGTVGLVTYQCCWWDERKRQVEWLTESEIKPKDASRKTKISIRG